MTRVFYALRRYDGRNTEGGTQEMKDVNKRSRIAELINDHAADVPKRKAASKRMSSEERFEQIVDVAVKIIGQKGYYGMSLQDVANEIGISQTAVIHRVKANKVC